MGNGNTTAGSNEKYTELTDCDKEPVHLIGHVQSHGCLIAVSQRWQITYVSRNCQEFLGLDPEKCLGEQLIDCMPNIVVHKVRNQLQIGSAKAKVSRLFGLDIFEDGRLFDISVHQSGSNFVMEFEEKTSKTDENVTELLFELMSRVKRSPSVQALAEISVHAMLAMTGFDRIMFYRFHDDGTGTVIAEHKEHHMESYLGLTFPASDIPKQARALFVKSRLRFISDTSGDISEIVSARPERDEELDLSLSATRAVSPIHLEYLRNMGVAASMSMSIVQNGKLWGLIACHHETPRVLEYERRSGVELFGELLTYELTKQENQQRLEWENRERDIHDNLVKMFERSADLHELFDELRADLSLALDFDGIAVLARGQISEHGTGLSQKQLSDLSLFLKSLPATEIFSTDRLGTFHPPAEKYREQVSGVLCLPLSREADEYLIFFRKEIAQTVTWAGNPETAVKDQKDGSRLTPRASFAAWVEEVKGRSKKWTEAELRVFDSLRSSLIELFLKSAKEDNAEQMRNVAQKEVQIAELNHRVRNILNLIHGLVDQSMHSGDTIERYTGVLGGRIQAIARAHDQLTKAEWNDASLRDLLDSEAAAFLKPDRRQVFLSGENVTLTPPAFSSIALVIHELVANAVTHGALKSPEGKVLVAMSYNADGSAQLSWRESGGAEVKPPERHGFGSTIIENTIPFELHGTADVRFEKTGLEVTFTIPPAALGRKIPKIDDANPLTVGDDAVPSKVEGNALILEDNMIIAKGAARNLAEIFTGEVFVASYVGEAMRLIDENEIVAAVLDINIGNQTSVLVANTLRDHQVPFLLVTGFSAQEAMVAEFPPAPILQKPYTRDMLRSSIIDQFTEI